MNKTVWRIFLRFTLISTSIAIILLFINILGVGYVGSDASNIGATSYYTKILRNISNNMVIDKAQIQLTDTSVIPENNWCILIDENGNIVWQHNKPNDIPDHYSINDIAKMTRWYLNDYPVYVRIEEYGLLVLGVPKNTVGKYDLQYSINWFETLPQRIILIFAVNVILAAILAMLLGSTLYKRIKNLTYGIKELRQEKSVKLNEKGLFGELSHNINETSEAICRKNSILLSRDTARSNWIAGISHDIRTPLSVIMGYSETLSKLEEISTENREKAQFITLQSIKIKKLIEDLNVISSLEYDMQPSKKKEVYICPLLRRVIAELINSGLSDRYKLQLDLKYEKAKILCDETLLERAFFNILNNAVSHNKNGCAIHISEYKDNNKIYIDITDNGCGIPNEVINNIDEIPKSAHGLGLPMAYKIINVHGGKMSINNDNGTKIMIEFIIL